MSYLIDSSDLSGRSFAAAQADNNEFPVFHSPMAADHWMVALDWDGANKYQVWRDIQTVQALLPEAGRPALYITAHGYHALFEHECRQEDVMTLLKIVSRHTQNDYYKLQFDPEFWKYVEASAECRGNVCSGYVAVAMTRGVKIRVGRKPGRPADMMRITPRSEADSPLLRAHDSALRKYKVVRNYPRVAARIWSRVIHGLPRSEADPLAVVCNEEGHAPGLEEEIEQTARIVAEANGITLPKKRAIRITKDQPGFARPIPCPGPKPMTMGGYTFWPDELHTPEQQAAIEADFENTLRNLRAGQGYQDFCRPLDKPVCPDNPIDGEMRPLSSDPMFDNLDLPF